MTSRTLRRSVAVLAVVLAVSTVLVACNRASVGQRCRSGFARDATHVLVCRNGRWARGVTLGQMLAFLIAVRRQAEAGGPSLSVSTVLGGIRRPWDIAFTPDGTMLFTERPGPISALVGGARRVLGIPPDVQAVAEGGMMGLAVDPAFAANRRIYTCLRSTAGGAADVRVVRWVVSADYASLYGRTDILTGIPASAASTGTHVGCRVRFGPDGALWVTTGDATGGSVPQSPTLLGGKVLRVTTDGNGAPGNPGGALDPRIYTRGHRNPQGVAFRPSDGQAYDVEHGPDRDDEVNRLVAGGNYGWNPVPYAGGTAYDQTTPMTDTGRVPGAIGAVWSSGSPTIAPSGATFLSGPQWKAWDGALAVAVLKGSQLRVMRLDGPGTSVVSQWTAVTDRGRLRVAVQGPDGNLYLATDDDNGSILRVVPS